MTELMTEAPSTPPSRRRRVWRIAGIAVVAVIVVVLGGRWLTGLTLLLPAGDAASGPVPIGRSIYADTGIGPSAEAGQPLDVTLTAVTPLVVENGSQATIEILVCTRNGGSTGVGMSDSVSDACSAVAPVSTPQAVALGFMHTQVILRITPHRPGTLHISGFQVDYTQGMRRGSQLAGLDLSFTTAS